jgi:hypothetical protein
MPNLLRRKKWVYQSKKKKIRGWKTILLTWNGIIILRISIGIYKVKIELRNILKLL